jgi:hypothetical protein
MFWLGVVIVGMGFFVRGGWEIKMKMMVIVMVG